ncbi:urease accessory protein UreE [Phaeobacter gallaeciensis]|uniref:Urease accessory protein UreE n=1 Tax=Phaeobacter gallaeciensis TaxID=60890 RepID=A0AAD0EEM9_9RHOB|nr:urease accessory protein UreE [Phaeobacter gallaeciensis]AHD11154.1 Urease accessory protein UreE [Phaeobacter gallaeciensis DSM 26640]ATE94417.1 Urease accessory protein UreE [Phaeobacter gallaeciensis]ATE98690.1 Urease accessory protein UreE [Phaeobacter gallaeciensis]ATF03081.1 Urease accessory protein UreE [Phaeobacter gallaeciensis]ATF07461.1 Urease accessory protein UreE [Phaeobacter gallaeciensis]
MSLPLSQHKIHAHDTEDQITLSYEDRFLRRKVLTSDSGLRFLADFRSTQSLDAGDAFVLEDGRKIGVRPADEALLEVTGDHILRLAWHIGNRHMPCQIEANRLLIQRDHVIRDMLQKLGAALRDVVEPFTPEGGAYGHGRTYSHSHSHSHDDGHGHSHAH